MIKPNTWHDALDLKICWRFFKYKLVLDEARNKLTRDLTLLQNAINRGQSLDETHLPAQSLADDKGPDNASKCTCCRCLNIPERSKDRLPVEECGAGLPSWKLPCELKTVVEVIGDLFPDIDALTNPLT